MSTLLRIACLFLLLSLTTSLSAADAYQVPSSTDTARELRHQSSDWLAIAPHLPDPEVASSAQLEVVGDVLRARRFPEEAILYYTYALRRGGNEAELTNRIGVTQLDLRHIELARLYFQRVVRLQRKDAQGWNNLGAVEYIDGRYKAAISDYSKAIKLNRQSATFHSNLGTAYFEQKNYEQARHEFEVALSLDPQMMEHSNATGVAARMLSPADHAHYCFEIARLYAHRGDEVAMMHFLAMAIEGGFDVQHDMGADQVMAAYRKDPRVLVMLQNARALRSGRASVDPHSAILPLIPDSHN